MVEVTNVVTIAATVIVFAVMLIMAIVA